LNPQMFFLLASELPPERLFGLDSNTFMNMGFLFLNVVVMAFIITKLIYKPMIDFLARRTERIQNDMDTAKKNLTHADSLRAEYEQRIKDIELEKKDILDDARKLAAESRDAQLAEARKEADAEKAKARKEILMES